jgi:two-component system sensor histidine kinase GlrK
VTPEQREIVAILQSNSAQLQRLIEDLLNYQRAVAGAGQGAPGPVDVADVARAVIESHKLEASGRSVSIALHALPAPALVEEEKIRVVIDNLVSNAIKFSPEGGTVRVVVSPGESDVAIEVADQGPGVAPEDRDKIFDWFFQGVRPSSGRVKGSGFGLAIAQELVAAHGGTIEIGEGPGGRFRVVVPRSPPPGETKWADASS